MEGISVKDLEFTDNERVELIYDIVAGIMSIIAVIIVMLDFSTRLTESQTKIVDILDKSVYAIFILDYFVKLFTSKNKKRFFKRNIIDLIAIMPFFLLPTNIGSVFKLIKIVAYILRLVGNIREVLFTNGFIYALISTITITVLGSVGIYIFEYGNSTTIHDYGDSLWWSFVTVTTVGYGDISPSTTGGRIIACILMITGIGFLSMLTSTISTFFFTTLQNKKNKEKKERREERLKDKEHVIIDISELSTEKRKNLLSYYEFLKDSNYTN
jgi:Ion channel.